MAKSIPVLIALESPVRLRPLMEADLPLTRQWRNRDDVRHWFINSKLITPEGHAEWFDHYERRNNDLMWVIEANGKLCGQVGLYDIGSDIAEFGRFMIGAPDMRGTGVGRIACALVTQYALQLGVSRVRLHVLAHNVRAIQVYRDCGYRTIPELSEPGIACMERAA